MSKNIKLGIAVAVILIGAIIIGAFLVSNKRKIASTTDVKSMNNKAFDTQESIIKSKFGFQITIPVSWRLANLINPFIDSKIKINDKYASEISDDLSNIEEEANNFDQKHGQELGDLIRMWNPQNSEFVIITSMTNDEEKALYGNPEALLNYNLEKIINIVVKDGVADPKMIKEENTDKKITKIFKLEDGTLASYLNIISMKKRIVQIPMETKQILANGKVAKGLFIETSEGAMSESDFINWAKTIKINLPE